MADDEEISSSDDEFYSPLTPAEKEQMWINSNRIDGRPPILLPTLTTNDHSLYSSAQFNSAPLREVCEKCTCKRCKTEKEDFLKRIKQLEETVETIWMHPDMPGGKLEFIEAQEELEEEESMSHKK